MHVSAPPKTRWQDMDARDFARGLPKNPVVLPAVPHLVRNCVTPTAVAHGRLWNAAGNTQMAGWDGKGWVLTAAMNNTRRPGMFEAFTAGGTPTYLVQTYSGNNTYIEVAADPLAAWTVALSITDVGAAYACYKNSLVYLGGGKVLFLQYTDTSRVKRIYFSADGGLHWGANAGVWDDGLPVLEVGAGKCIRHFHGAVYDSALGILYVLTGDGTDEASILVCDNLDPTSADSLMRYPDLWKERWALRDVDHGARAAQLAANPTYSLSYGGSRVGPAVCAIDMVLRGSYAFYAPDQTGTQNYVTRVHRTTRVVAQLGAIVGTGWYGLATSDGHVLVSTASHRSGAAYAGTSDEYVRLYAVLSDDATVVLLRKWRRSDYLAPGSGVGVQAYRLLEFLGHVWYYTEPYGSVGLTGRWIPSDVFRVVDLSAGGAAPSDADLAVAAEDVLNGFNWVSNPRFVSATTGWATSNCAIARDTGVLDKEAGTYVASLKITPSSDAAAYTQQAYATGPESNMVGRFWTFACRVKLPVGRPGGTQNPMLSTSGGAAPIGSWPTFADADFDGGWHELALPFFCKASDPTLAITVWAHNGATGSGHQPIYVSDVRVVPGARPGALNAPCIDML